MLDVTVVSPLWILNQDCFDLTVSALDSVGDVPKILVDNASPTGGGYLRTRADIYVRNKTNLGFAAAVNEGIKLAKTRYVAVLSNDVRVSPNWKEAAEGIFSSNNVFSCHFRMTDYDVPFVGGNTTMYTGKERWCTAAFFVLDREKDLYFDERFFNSYEDWDLFKRARDAGYYTAYTDKACYQHKHSFTQKLVGFPKTDENRALYTKIHGGDPDELFAKEFPEQVKMDYLKGFEV
jgi:GT2 family glycosyltransferase